MTEARPVGARREGQGSLHLQWAAAVLDLPSLKPLLLRDLWPLINFIFGCAESSLLCVAFL